MRSYIIGFLAVLALLCGCESKPPKPQYDHTGYRTAEFRLLLPDRWSRVSAVSIRKDPTGMSHGTLNWEDPSRKYYVVFHGWTEQGAAEIGDYRERIKRNPANAYEDNTNVEFHGAIVSPSQDILFDETSVGGLSAYRGTFQDRGKRVRVLICRLQSGELAIVTLIGVVELTSEEDFNRTWASVEAGISNNAKGG